MHSAHFCVAPVTSEAHGENALNAATIEDNGASKMMTNGTVSGKILLLACWTEADWLGVRRVATKTSVFLGVKLKFCFQYNSSHMQYCGYTQPI